MKRSYNLTRSTPLIKPSLCKRGFSGDAAVTPHRSHGSQYQGSGHMASYTTNVKRVHMLLEEVALGLGRQGGGEPKRKDRALVFYRGGFDGAAVQAE